MIHLDEKLWDAARLGDERAEKIRRSVNRLTRAAETLKALGVCPECMASQVEEVAATDGVRVLR